jgi:NAD(P)-dependent dehydrogenase (short-subunit alcohol dehydrogenase family)
VVYIGQHAAILRTLLFFAFQNIMALDIRGKAALVTGGASGICLELTRQLLAGGCNVVIADLTLRPDAKAVIDAKHSDGARAVFVETDVANWAQLQNSFDYAVQEFGHLDIVVPGAGIFEPPVCASYPTMPRNSC